ncbi:MAG: hypothetical protein L0J13_15055, partial [Brevibacterium sp.]|nr:hypothetical protein [Brevibacterium sp.]
MSSNTERSEASPQPDSTMGWGHRFINAAMRTLYFGRIRILDLSEVDSADSANQRPRLIISSHRNGAIDGHQVLAACPRAQFLISIQLIRSWFLRLFI